MVKSNQGKRAVAAIYRFKNSKKRLSFKTRESLRAEEADLMSKLISGPSNFSHVQHMGPGDGLQILKDPAIVRSNLHSSWRTENVICTFYSITYIILRSLSTSIHLYVLGGR